ncbi:MAG: HEPN domain-containing protein [bacterium]|nr:HEPN domain-containing protein [bacterium]
MTNQWLDKAEDDLNAAQTLFDHGGDLWSIVAFHCQQSVEKFLKAMLTSLQVEFSKTTTLPYCWTPWGDLMASSLRSFPQPRH